MKHCKIIDNQSSRWAKIVFKFLHYPQSNEIYDMAITKGLYHENLQQACFYTKVWLSILHINKYSEIITITIWQNITEVFTILYQNKVELLFFAIIAIQPNIAFVVSKLSWFNQ